MPANLHTVKKWITLPVWAVMVNDCLVSLQPTEEAALKLANERNNEFLKANPPMINEKEKLD